ncbi:cadherin-like beta sandwich domain-containing protein [Acetanaerobacterium elongatum]|uniref:Cadherin-like beta sandwich domain-containing protein n=1 Tax=Acetanaerobacterium elongatum TaxID=258515 RepID=A0A1G9VMI9_9FIRM|nr:cadherin-like beta sandwich domain-containing protein [Acetanaerobacterium elongatum]SDM73015.1 Cadherin-like beta sandwich domain-containing protein [Acetanaerobacterium elongatum]
MKRHTYKIIMLIMVLSLLVEIFPVYSEELGNKWLQFDKTGDTSQAIIVEGRGIHVKNTAPSGYYLSRLIIRDSSNAEVEPGTVCTINQSNDTLNAVVGANGVYSVMGDFYTLNAVGDAQENYCSVGASGPIYFPYVAKVTSDKNNLIKQDSYVYLDVTDIAPDGAPKFVMNTSTSVGVFKDFNLVSSSKPTATTGDKFTYTVGFYNSATTAKLTIQLITEHLITKDSSFRISFATQKSDSLILVIKTKQQLVEDVKKAIMDPNQRKPYIQLTGYDDLDFITSDFTVAKRVEVYGVNVDLKWLWEANNAAYQGAITINEPLFSLFDNVRVKRQEDDVEGKLTATIIYWPSGAPEADKVDEVCPLRLVIKGSGTSPSARIQKTADPSDSVPIEPTNVLDINKGNISGFPQQTGSYNPLNILFLLGKKGGRADYFTITSSNTGIVDALKGFSGDGVTNVYTWKSKLENPGGNELVEDPVQIQFLPKQVGITTITAEYYVTASSGDRKIFELKFNLQVVDTSPDKDSTLSNLEVFGIDATGDSAVQAISFKPDTKNYNLSVGHWIQSLSFRPTKNSVKASSNVVINVYKDNVKDNAATASVHSGSKSSLFSINDANVELYTFELTVTAQDTTVSVYRINIERLPPSDDSTLSNLVVKDDTGTVHPYTRLSDPNNKTFDPGVKTYNMSLPYNIKRITLETPTTHAKATVAITPEPQDDLNIFDPNKYIAISTDTLQVAISVTAEDGVSKSTYYLNITRQPPDTNALLASLDIKDYTTQLVSYPFDKYTIEYDTILLSNDVRFITVYPVPESKYATVQVNSTEVAYGKGLRIDLDVNVTKSIMVTVLAENGHDTMTYSLSVKRQLPSSDPSLSDLTVGSLTLSPVFSPTNQIYTATATGTTTTVTVTPTTTHKKATVTVEGVPVKSGSASAAIKLAEKTVITVVCTAEDKVTKRTYTVTVTNDDLRVKSSNADLKSLKVDKGDMSPVFKSSITAYNVPVENDVDYIDIFPVPADSRAKIVVKQGSKEIGDYNGNYSQAIKSGANKFTIEVTADDGKTKKAYSLNINRGVNGQQGTLKPISTDQIDFKKSKVIYVDITKYATVSSKVFVELKKYPDTTIIFQGNDYSLSFKGSDLSTVVPFAESYNFSMSFTSPDEADLRVLMGSESNTPLITMYFKYHGALPGKATLMVDLGTKYKSRALYLHYYNLDMKRNDYYGKVTTNSRGTVAFKIDHCSTYFLAGKVVKNAADKSGEVNVTVSDAEKVNPDTGLMY